MNEWWWFSWFLTGYNVLGMWITGQWRRAGWLFMVLGGIPWAFYAMVTEQDGWMVGNLFFMSVYIRNWWLETHQPKG